MTERERQIIKEIRPLLDAGARGRLMIVYQNLTTKQRNAQKCRCGCGKKVLQSTGKRKRKFASHMCLIRHRFYQNRLKRKN